MGIFDFSEIPTYPVWNPIQIRRKVFVSYFHGDREWAQYLVDEFGVRKKVFIPKALGLEFAGSESIDSRNSDYIMDQVRERCIVEASVQIVLIGQCTHSRRYIDWEIKRSLAAGNGLLGIILPPHLGAYLPERFYANWSEDGSGYAILYNYPRDEFELREWIETAYSERTICSNLIVNWNDTWGYNKQCKICKLVH